MGIPPSPCNIWVDADSCPAKARDFILNTAARHGLSVFFVANRSIPFAFNHALFNMVVCKSGPDSADRYITEHACPHDLVVTRDIPLAAQLVHKQIPVINDRGVQFNETTVKSMLEQRNLKLQWKALGVAPKGVSRTYGPKEFSAFCACLESVLSALLKNPCAARDEVQIQVR
ncbi:MAG: DUF188 domain-containing protein [Treponema sp.]|nr:DUF188 domain-containing protein [Treponema sp.]